MENQEFRQDDVILDNEEDNISNNTNDVNQPNQNLVCDEFNCYHDNPVNRIKCFVGMHKIDFEKTLMTNNNYITSFYRAYKLSRFIIIAFLAAITFFIIGMIIYFFYVSYNPTIIDYNYLSVKNSLEKTYIAFFIITLILSIANSILNFLFLFYLGVIKSKSDYIKSCYVLSFFGVFLFIPSFLSALLYGSHFKKIIDKLKNWKD